VTYIDRTWCTFSDCAKWCVCDRAMPDRMTADMVDRGETHFSFFAQPPQCHEPKDSKTKGTE
jgi:hypothetical protein